MAARWCGPAGATTTSYTLASPQLSDNGAHFPVNVANNGGSVFSNEALLTVTSNQAPTPTIVEPTAGLRYTGGMTVVLAGIGTDPEDGALSTQAFTWQIDFHHDTHTHPFMPPTSGFAASSFVIPASGETSANVWYRISLTVTDSGGRSRTVQRDILPQVVRVTLAASPAGLQVRLDGQPVSTPHVRRRRRYGACNRGIRPERWRRRLRLCLVVRWRCARPHNPDAAGSHDLHGALRYRRRLWTA